MASKAPAKAETKSLLEKVLAKAKATKTKATLCIDLGQICLTDSYSLEHSSTTVNRY